MKKKLTKKLLSFTLVLTLVLGINTIVIAAEPTNNSGYVYVAIEKTAVYKTSVDASNIDYILEPTRVDLADVPTTGTPADGISDITVLDVLLYAAGQQALNYDYYTAYSAYYVAAVQDLDYVPADYIAGSLDYVFSSQAKSIASKYGLSVFYTGSKVDTGWLREFDIVQVYSGTTLSGGTGWMISVENVGPFYGVSTIVSAGDVLRMEWTSFNGMDVGYTGFFNKEGNWVEEPPFIYDHYDASTGNYVKIDKDVLVERLAVINATYTNMNPIQQMAHSNANNVLKTLTALPVNVSNALALLDLAF